MNSSTNYCRMCIKRDDNQDFFLLAEDHAHLKQKFEVCFSIPLNPSHIHVLCPRCAEKLTEIAMVFMMVKDSDMFFKQLPSSAASQHSSNENLNFVPPEQIRYQDSAPRSMNQYNREFYAEPQKIPQLMTLSMPIRHQNTSDPPVYRPRHHPEYHPGYGPFYQHMNRREREPKPYHNPRGNFRPYHQQGPSRRNDYAPPAQQQDNRAYPPGYYYQNTEREYNYNTNYARGEDMSDSIEISDSEDAADDNDNGERNYSCSNCNMVFDCAIKRKYHYMEVHPDFNRYKCYNCDDAFQFKKGLNLHMQLFDHMRCNLCQMPFDNLNLLEMHIQGCKPLLFNCAFCPKKFATAKGRFDHSKTVHKQ